MDTGTVTPAQPRAPSFGISVTPYAETYPQIVEQILAAERTGFDLVGIQDHPYQRRFLDTFALIADLLARTSRLRFFPDVASLPMRPPTMLAKAAASLDVMSGGRFELGLGAGNFWDAVAGMGGPRREVGERGAALEEAIDIIRAALDVGTERGVVRGAGPFYPVPGYPAGPPPVHRVEIWVGAMAPRALELIGRKADGWIPGGGISRIDEFASLAAHIDDAATAAGRDPRAIRRILNVAGSITDGAIGDGPLDGPPKLWIEKLSGWAVDLRIDAFVVWPPDAGPGIIEKLAAEVVPAVREATATPTN
jgi:alkanesulfonate monooxygenase SsuD/methylene tetrahydromethanopterin reductase-like flavin-dependent oxidoreductase (luciferase family)